MQRISKIQTGSMIANCLFHAAPILDMNMCLRKHVGKHLADVRSSKVNE